MPEFTSDKLKVFLICSLLKDIFVRIFWIVIIFFLYKNVNVSYLVAYVNKPTIKTKCLHVLHAYVYTLRGQEQKNLVLLRRLTKRLMR